MIGQRFLQKIAVLTIGGMLAWLPAANAEDAPTARYVQGEDVDLALIIAEWKGRYPDIPVFSCVCQDDTCNFTERWPLRAYSRYQSTVALGPFNATYTESRGFTCFDIQTGQRPGAADQAAAPPAESPPPQPELGQPTLTVLEEGSQLRLTWPGGQSNTIDISGWNVNLLDALDCDSLSQVSEKRFYARRILGTPALNPGSGNIAVPILLNECVETQQTALFVVEPQSTGAYALYRVQVPGPRSLPDEFSSYPLNSITGVQYWNSTLLVRQGTASGAESLLMFRPGITPAGEFAGCGITQVQEGADSLCP
jgi:hypothetical protein